MLTNHLDGSMWVIALAVRHRHTRAGWLCEVPICVQIAALRAWALLGDRLKELTLNTSRYEWHSLFDSEQISCSPSRTVLTDLLKTRSTRSSIEAAEELRVSPGVLLRYIRVSTWPEAFAAYAVGGAPLLNQFFESLACEEPAQSAQDIVT